ncbi:hypothetical protein C4J81_18150 [Deltaproteobacteria bacterium Smac51]|nr:hypothetical protein C4J81_18150 [Deltaproteobacteria bacterium Smac51]
MSVVFNRILLLACVCASLVLTGCLGKDMTAEIGPQVDMDVAERAPGSLDFDVIDYRWSYFNDGAHIRIKGTARNNSTAAYQSVTLQGVLYDQKGRLVAHGTSYLAPTYLKPGATGDFEIVGIAARRSGVTNTRLVTNCRTTGY